MLYLVLFVGCGSILTLLSCFYVQDSPILGYPDVAPVEAEGLRFGYPFPVFSSMAELWTEWGTSMSFHADFVWLGTLLDIALYSFIVGAIFLEVRNLKQSRRN